MGNLQEKQDRYFECLEVCVEDEQQRTCTEVCTDELTDDPNGPHVFIPDKKNDESWLFLGFTLYFNQSLLWTMNKRLEEIEFADIDEFLAEAEEKAKEIGVSLQYYLEEFL